MAELSQHRPRHSTDNGQPSSTIYDYPEHLNPFYQDENHKRLRFWNHKPSTCKSQRRGSLSSIRDGFRELWQYSTLRFGKKRSSTLGINKTSESPPPLRRDPYDEDYGSTSYTGHRNTVNGSGYGTVRESRSYTTTPLFERQTRYRSSFQPRSQESDDSGFTRNNRYRSTIQNGYATYNNGMVTSTPQKKQAPPQPYGTTSRVPQQHNNSNPFDDDVEADGDTLSTISMDDSYSSTLRSRTSGTRTRTKRRAPPPPPVTVELAKHPEQETEVNESQSEDLRNLTAEIASFVSSANEDEAAKTESLTQTSTITVETRTEQTFDVNNNNARVDIPTTVASMENEVVQEHHVAESIQKEPAVSTVKVTSEQQVIESHNVSEAEAKPQNNQSVPAPTVEETATDTATETAGTSPTPVPRKKSEKHQNNAALETETVQKVDIDFENLALPETPVPSRRSNRERYITEQAPPASQPIIANPEPKIPNHPTEGQQDDDEGPTTTIIVDNLHYKLKVAPIHTEINTKIENARLKISESTGNIPTSATENGTTERRRSVKDIIESINKSQSMLKVNLEQQGLHETQSTDSMTRNIRELNEREKEIQNLLHDIDSRYGAAGGPGGGAEMPVPSGRGSYYDNLPDDNLNDNLDDMNNMYASSGHRVKKSPTKTVIIAQADDQFQDCIDWNPLPKPKRVMVESVTGAGEQSRLAENAPS
ncbi:uncharacterized protein LOC131281863 [Anopheles ziemanni]|uniref:uncharacterized protein LOC131265402 n=1 Tax=Anopheles coustani TaxID=139045 RepID=UPI002659E4D6|nr:uncharacterized protein LOC131265402 [Anopheles coustani]XP_058167203.1 uncharacterized protein LOC131281863 [Anopheles ziemanni]